MAAIELKDTLLRTVDSIDANDTAILQKALAAVRKILSLSGRGEFVPGKDITPFVASMRTGVNIPADLDVDKLRAEYLESKHQ